MTPDSTWTSRSSTLSRTILLSREVRETLRPGAAQLHDSYDVLRRTGMHDDIGKPGSVERLAHRVLGTHCLALNHVVGAQRDAQLFFQPVERVSGRQHD